MQKEYSDEIKHLTGINERFEQEPQEIKNIRTSYADFLELLIEMREQAGRSFAGRDVSIAITDLENACIRTVKASYALSKTFSKE